MKKIHITIGMACTLILLIVIQSGCLKNTKESEGMPIENKKGMIRFVQARDEVYFGLIDEDGNIYYPVNANVFLLSKKDKKILVDRLQSHNIYRVPVKFSGEVVEDSDYDLPGKAIKIKDIGPSFGLDSGRWESAWSSLERIINP